MTRMVDTATDPDQGAEFRSALVDKLRAEGVLTSSVVERAFRRVPRHLFLPGLPLEEAYADDAPVVKRDEHGVIVSSVSAPGIIAFMLEQLHVRPGHRVLEIGSGGYNAALLRELVGPDGKVTTIDIDQEVVDRARQGLAEAGYDDVNVLCGDAEFGAEKFAPFDRITVTVGAWDIPLAWVEQLSQEGRLVVPLRMNGITRSIGFRREGDHLVSTSAEVCGFVLMQGAGAHNERVFLLPDGRGHQVKLRFDGDVPQEMSLLDGVLATERTEVWSGVTIKNNVSFADLHLWFASFLPGFCKLAVDEGTELAAERKGWFPFGAVRGDSFAYLAVRPALDGAGVEFGARAYGAHGEVAATAMVEQIQTWDRQACGGPAPTFAYWPTGTDYRSQISKGVAVLEKEHGVVTISWPTTAGAPPQA